MKLLICRRVYKSLLCVVVSILTANQVLALSSDLRVRYFIAENNTPSNVVVIDGGRNRGVLVDSILETQREAFVTENQEVENFMVKTGRLKVIKVDETVTIARLIGEESELSRALFPKYPGVMAGDLVQIVDVSISRNQGLVPIETLAYDQLFEDPKAYPVSFEMTAQGKRLLKDRVAVFENQRLTMLLVEGYTDHRGNSETNQVESYQRALTVRQYLINDLGFDSNRVVALGFGETEPVGENYVPGNKALNRRIVLKVKTLADKSQK